MMLPMKLFFFCIFFLNFTYSAKRKCGGTYTATRGIIHTPNFPGPLKVPITCEWVIDSQLVATPNTSIVVYLTQLFVFEGLSFVEYQLYDSDYKIHPKVIHEVNETNINRIRWLQTYQSFLVIRLELQSSDSAHLRVLDNFLDVYGFNITYEITSGTVRSNSCIMMDCGFNGICYDYYTKFKCECFDGYEGSSCSDGPKSLCHSTGEPICKNGGSCLHVGTSAVKCVCPKNSTGNTCEHLVSSGTAKECPTCKSICPYDGRLENACKCSTGKEGTTEKSSFDRMGFTTSMHFANLPNMEDYRLKSYIQKQVEILFDVNVNQIGETDIDLLSPTSETSSRADDIGRGGNSRKRKQQQREKSQISGLLSTAIATLEKVGSTPESAITLPNQSTIYC